MPRRRADLDRAEPLLPPQVHDLAHQRLRGPVRRAGAAATTDRPSRPRPIAAYRSAHRFAVGQDTWKNAAACATGHPSSTIRRAMRSALDRSQSSISVGHEDLLVVEAGT